MKNYIVFDLETTGLDAKKNKIIEIGAVKYINEQEVGVFSYLINPEIPIPDFITKITGISNFHVKNCETIDKIMPKFIEFIGDYELVGFNVGFDIGFVKFNYDGEILNKIIDVLPMAKRKFKNVKNHKLETLKLELGLDFGSHRATDDCRTTNEVYKHCTLGQTDNNSVVGVSRMINRGMKI